MKIKDARYLYIKNGDAAMQIKSIFALNGATPNGPDGFISNFLNSVEGASVLFLSTFKDSNNYIKVETVEAQCFPSEIKNWGFIGTVIARINFTINGFFRALCFKPNRIICVRRGTMLWLGYLIGHLYSAPVVYVSHDKIEFTSGNLFKKWAALIDEWCIRNMKSCACQGQYTTDQLKAIGVRECNLYKFDGSYRYIHELAHQPNAHHNYDKNSKNLILYIGRIEKNKGVFDLLKASCPLLNKHSHLQLIYAGTGDGVAKLKELRKIYNVESQVSVLGKIPYSDIPPLMKAAKVLVSPTHTTFHEGHRHAIMEGFILGLPAIAPDFGPYPYYIKNNENGLLYKPDSVDDLQDKLFSIICNDTLQKNLSNRAFQFGQNIIDPETTFEDAVKLAFSEHSCNK